MASRSESGRPRRPRVLTLAVVLALCASSCAAHYTKRPIYSSPTSYTLGPGDEVTVTSVAEQEIRFQGPIGPTGELGLPLIGVVSLLGLTLQEARELINQRYASYLRDANVTVAVVRFSASLVHVMGEVRAPGSYAMTDSFQTTALTAIQGAGSFDPVTAALDEVRVVRGALGNPEIYRVDLEALLDGELEDAALDLPLEPGDIVYVPPRWVTSMDRSVRQFLSPITAISGAVVPTVVGTGLPTSQTAGQ